jgi:hypothetical protein
MPSARLRIGDVRGLRRKERVLPALVVHDLGVLSSSHGEQVVRIRVIDPAWADSFELDVPVGWLEQAPAGAEEALASLPPNGSL